MTSRMQVLWNSERPHYRTYIHGDRLYRWNERTRTWRVLLVRTGDTWSSRVLAGTDTDKQ